MKETRSKSSLRQLLVKKKVVVTLVIVVGVLAIITVGLIFFNYYFKVQTVLVDKGDSTRSIQGVQSFSSENIFFLKESEVADTIYRNNSYIQTVKVTKKLPSTLSLVITFYKPAAQFEISEGYFLLSNDGRILEKTKILDRSLPTIHYYQKLNYFSYKAGSRLDFKDIRASLVYLDKAKDLGLAIKGIDIHGFNMIALDTEDKVMLFTLEKSQRDQLYQFERVIKQLKIQGKEFKKLDLRFDRIIIEN